MYDLMAAGCPVIAASPRIGDGRASSEAVEGIVAVDADAASIANAIDSLLVDRVRLNRLLGRAADRVRDLPDSRGAAGVLLRAHELAGSSGVSPCHQNSSRTRGPMAHVA
jgi:hypothetical protein